MWEKSLKGCGNFFCDELIKTLLDEEEEGDVLIKNGPWNYSHVKHMK